MASCRNHVRLLLLFVFSVSLLVTSGCTPSASQCLPVKVPRSLCSRSTVALLRLLLPLVDPVHFPQELQLRMPSEQESSSSTTTTEDNPKVGLRTRDKAAGGKKTGAEKERKQKQELGGETKSCLYTNTSKTASSSPPGGHM
ncbi:unnamed protein product [Pleuronectes platessa]|uniref:Uncharacterized protein n=1 Tax=Pleuronectes platessa TaxID=8262 RepID=A0A9N7W459_PLEPL|nr:unnamed protein product [Pleuronectes platessa]